jgi:transposase
MAPVDRNHPTRGKGSESKYSLMEFMAEFPDDETCLEWLWRRSYSPDGRKAHCPKCDRERSFHRVKSRPSYSCDTCGHHLHPTAGTIFHKSSTSLHLWFFAIFLMSQTRCGTSAKELERQLGVTYKTAWRMFHLIRNQLMSQDDDEPLSGEVEIDETWVGGKLREGDRRRNRAKGWSGQVSHYERHTPVFAAVERRGRVRATVVPHTRANVLEPVTEALVLPASIIFTDENPTYNRVGAKYRQHHRIKHKERIYVDGNVHTQTIEGFFGLVKNGIRGTYHAVSRKHLQGYLNEYAFRYNHRDDPESMFKIVLSRIRPLDVPSPS